jgi:alpha-L-fucosidase
MPIVSWFEGAGFGLFVHWDHASQQGLEVSWPLTGGVFALPKAGSVPVDQYHSSAATFDPVEFDAPALARVAKQAGMTYAVLTARHHAGYALWPTAWSDYSVHNSPCGRDLVGEFIAAMRAEGLRVGLYLSLSDWHQADYPPFTDADQPYQFGSTPPPPSPERWARYMDYLFGQVRELLTSYGTIDVLWFDGAWERPADWWRPEELKAFITSLQPEILVNDRLPGVGDFTTPEQFVPPQPLPGLWETCLTMNDSWGYVPEDTDYKSARRLIHTLCETVAKGGNLLLNVSPTGSGALPVEQTERLETIATWMGRHGEAIVGVEPGLEPWQFYGPSTRRGDRVYLHLLWRPYDQVTVRGVPVKRVRRVQALGSGQELSFRIRTGIIETLFPDPDGELTIDVPAKAIDADATVLAVDLEPAQS